MLDMPILETARLLIRPFMMEDLPDIHQILDVELNTADLETLKVSETFRVSLEERSEWLQWSVLNYNQLAKLYQPPYGDRALVLKSNGKLIGACGFVPCLMPFEQLPGFTTPDRSVGGSRNSTEFGLFYAISPVYQRQGCASEAAQALIDYAFQHLNLKRIVATTDYDNLASQSVMRKLGMRIERNPLPELAWMQVVGIIDNLG
jgi:[ribosomal protein S5]-alanine N-acetyltransferase